MAALGLAAGTLAATGTATAGAATAAKVAGTATTAAGAHIAPQAIVGVGSAGVNAATAVWIKLSASAVLAVVVGSVAVSATRSSSTPTAPRSPLPSTARAPAAIAPSFDPGALRRATEPSDLPSAPEAPAPTGKAAPIGKRGPASPPSAVAVEPPQTSLALELSSLDRARAALASGDATRALAEVDRHERAFPAGSLGPEAQLLRIDARLGRGETASARTLARRLLARDPSGPYAQRLRTIAEAAP